MSRAEGTYSCFYKFYLDGQELTEGTDYVSEEGSTKITIRAQTFLTQQTGGPDLFVNAANDSDRVDEESGLPIREVFLTPEYDNRHDVFFANIGDEEMTGIYVKLENAENAALDDYWTVRENFILKHPKA